MADFNMLLPSFVMFVRSHDPNEEYNYMDNENCPWAKFLRSQGYRDAADYGTSWQQDDASGRIQHINEFHLVLAQHEWTWGALSQRLDAYLERHPINLVAGEL